jgi:hypothetical protein
MERASIPTAAGEFMDTAERKKDDGWLWNGLRHGVRLDLGYHCCCSRRSGDRCVAKIRAEVNIRQEAEMQPHVGAMLRCKVILRDVDGIVEVTR